MSLQLHLSRAWTRSALVLTLGLCTGLGAAPPAHAQPVVQPEEEITAPEPLLSTRTLQLHAGGGLGFALMTSEELTGLLGDDFGIGLGLHLSGSVALGIRHYLQAEVRWGDSSHTLRNNNIVTKETTEIDMDYDFTEYVLKFNVLAVTAAGRADPAGALFVIGGKTDVTYIDGLGDGFSGTANLFGLEYTRFARFVTVSGGIRRYGIEFDEITLGGISGQYEVDASNWVLHTSITLGLGI